MARQVPAASDADRARRWFVESLDRVNRAIQGTNDLEQMMTDVLDASLSIFDCDRAWLMYPCDPNADRQTVQMLRAKPEFPRLHARDLPMDAETAEVLRVVRASSGPLQFGPVPPQHPLSATLAERLGIRSQIAVALYPKGDQPSMFGLSQCAYPRVWTTEEQQLFGEIGRRLADALTSLLIVRRLRESERRLEEAQRLAHVGYWERDVETGASVWSDETYRVFGLVPQERNVPLAELFELVHPEDRPLFVAATTALRGGRPYELEYRVLRPNGDVRFVHAQGDLRADDSGRARRMFGTVQDVTDRKRAEYLAAQVFESSPDRVAIIGRDYRLRQVNPVFERFWNVPAARALSMTVADIVGEEMFEETFKPHLDRCFAGEDVTFAAWLHYRFGRRYVAITYTPLRPSSERVEASLMISRDLTDHMVAVETLQKAQAELAHVTRVTSLGELAASIAHEVKQPLAAVVAEADACRNWLATPNPPLDVVREALDAIVADGHRAGDVIQRIRQLATKTDPQREAVAINDLIGDMLPLLRPEVHRHDVSLRLDLAPNLRPVHGDRVQLQQVLINLVMNGMEAMTTISDRPREMIIRSRPHDTGVLVAVEDAGVGLDETSMARLFDAFFTTKPGGLGMGLSISRSMIEAHGGRLWATTNTKHGATFHFTVPALG